MPLYLTQSRPLRYGVFFLLYVMQGLPAGFALTALANYLAAEGVDAGEIGAFVALVGLPWGLKFLWGPIVDRYTFRSLGNRRPWIVGAQLLAFVCLICVVTVGDPQESITTLGLLFCIHAVFASLQDVAVDALAIEVVPEPERGRTNAFMRGGFVSGTAVGAAGLGYLLRNGGFHLAATTEAVLLGGLTLLLFFVRERPGDSLFPWTSSDNRPTNDSAEHDRSDRPNWSFVFGRLFRAIISRNSLLFTLAISLTYVVESLFRRVVDVYLIQEAGWTDVGLSALKGTVGTLFTLSIVFLGGWLVDRVGGKRVLLVNITLLVLLLVGFSLAQQWWFDRNFTTAYLLVKAALDTLTNVAAIPIFMLLCRPGIEGSQFVFYMALSNQMDVLGASLVGTASSYFSIASIGLIGAGSLVGAGVLVLLTTHPRPRPNDA